MDRDKLLLSRLIEYRESDAVPFHMPGHKRCAEHEMLRSFPNPYSIDITEIEGFDNLHHPEGILKESMEWAAEVYHAKKTYYLVNGSSGGILSAVCACTCPGGHILISRNCHKAAYHGVILNGLKPRYVYPQILDEMGIQGGICAGDVEKILESDPLTEAVLIVSPTYDGIVSDIRAIAEVVHRRGIPLIVDEAHGAHFPFGGEVFPESALKCGADIVIQSLHKTLPCFTQTAVLHVCGERVREDKLERYLQIFQSSSPSYVFMAGIENCIYEMEQSGGEWMREFAVRLGEMREKLVGLEHLKLLGRSAVGRAGVFDVDQSKIVVLCGDCYVESSGQDKACLSGEQLGGWLREKYHLEMEMCGADYVVAITTFLDDCGQLDRLVEALTEIDGQLSGPAGGRLDSGLSGQAGGRIDNQLSGQTADRIDGQLNDKIMNSDHAHSNEMCMTPSEALEADCESLPMDRCAGRISAEFIYLYPPGIPIVVPGERVPEEIAGQVARYKGLGLPVQGMSDKKAEYLKVLRG